jgi:hypothetical protein
MVLCYFEVYLCFKGFIMVLQELDANFFGGILCFGALVAFLFLIKIFVQFIQFYAIVKL